MNRCDVIMGVVIINLFFKCAQRVILLVCKVSLSFHISFLSYRKSQKKPRGNRVKFLQKWRFQHSYKWSYMQETSVKGNKIKKFSKKITHDLETLGGIHKKNGTLLETSLQKNCGKRFSLSHKNWRSLYQKDSNWKSQICSHQKKNN